MNKPKKITVYWQDAVIYGASFRGKKLKIKPHKMITEGIVEKESKEWIIIKDPYTINVKKGERNSKERLETKATFLFIPRGMIEKIEKKSKIKKEVGQMIETRNVFLRNIENADMLILHKWRNDLDFLKNCSNRRNIISLEEFKQELTRDFQRDRHIQMMIMAKKGGTAIGTIYSYNFKEADKYAFVTIYIARAYQKRGYGAEALIAFVRYLFSKLSLFKVYVEVYEYNKESLSALRGAKLSEEGIFKGQRLFSKKRYDVIRFAIYRKDAERFKNFPFKIINKKTAQI